MAQMQVQIRYGVDSITKTYDSAPTVGQIRRDANLKAALGFGDNIKLLINGIEMPDSAVVGSQTVVIETAANQKA